MSEQRINIALVYPAVDVGLEQLSRDGVFPPLGLGSIATYLQNCLGERINVSIYDLTVEDGAQFLRNLDDFQYIGISTNSYNYESALNIAKMANRNGMKVILGGIHARALGNHILENREYIDYVVYGEGEEALLALVQGVEERDIPNFLYRSPTGKVVRNALKEISLESLPIIDRQMLRMDRYFENFGAKNIHKFPFNQPTSVYSHKGCRWRDTLGGCVFCARDDTRFKTRNPEHFYKEIKYLAAQFGIDYLWNIADDILGDMEWLEDLARTMDGDINVSLLNYARADNINEDSLSVLRSLKTFELVIGFETGDSRLLESSRKGSGISDHMNAVNALSKSGICVYPMFVIGLPGESESTVDVTLDFIRKLISECNVTRFVVSFLIPFPGSIAFGKLKRIYPARYSHTDLFPISDAVSDWFAQFTSLSNLDYIKEKFDVFNNMGYYENNYCKSYYSFEFVRR